ncbi:protein HEXIM2-like [Cloeon dipterum]|uniref:protein HEXIM2-like n=1 Tax=Cloeon dipterum TaxID=197152 RepID=UPI003220875F
MSVSGPISPQSESKCSVVMSASGHFETQPSTPASPSSPQVKADDGSGIKILAEVAEGAAMACSKSPRRHQVTSPRSRAESRKKRLSGVCKRRRRARKRKSGSGSSKKSGSSQEMQSASRRMQLTVAPNNTTQFLIEDHNDSIDIDMPANPKGREGRRERDSSISVDTDDEYYSSPPDEQEYYLNDFNDAYDDGKSGDLQSQPRNKLMENVVMLEKIVERLTSELAILKNQPLEYLLEPNYRAGLEAAQTRKCQAEISRLQAEINKLRVENECLKKHCYSPAPVYSSSEDSESDSNSSTGSSSSDEELEDDQEKDVLPAITLAAAQEASDESDAE